MDADEQAICEYLRSWSGQWVALREISRRACGKKRYNEDAYWANQLVVRMVEKGLIQTDSAGHYRLQPPEKRDSKTKKKWVAPHIKRILEQSGKDFVCYSC